MRPTLTLSVLFAGGLLSPQLLPAQTATESSTPSVSATVRAKAARAKAPTPTPVATPAESTPTPDQQERAHGRHGNAQDLVSFGHSASVAEGETVKDAVVFGGDLDMLGTAEGDVVCFGGRLKLGPHAVVKGDAISIGGHADIDPGAQIHGQRVNMGAGAPFLGPFRHRTSGRDHHRFDVVGRVSGVIWQIVWYAFYAFCALIISVFLPQHLLRVEEHLTAAFPRSALLGLAAMVGLPIVTLILVATCVGILLVPILMLAVFASAIMGYVALAHVLGQRLLVNSGAFVQILIGVLLLQAAGILAALLALLPGGVFSVASFAFGVLDAVVCIVVSFLGLGAVLFSRWGRSALPQAQ